MELSLLFPISIMWRVLRTTSSWVVNGCLFVCRRFARKWANVWLFLTTRLPRSVSSSSSLGRQKVSLRNSTTISSFSTKKPSVCLLLTSLLTHALINFTLKFYTLCTYFYLQADAVTTSSLQPRTDSVLLVPRQTCSMQTARSQAVGVLLQLRVSGKPQQQTRINGFK